MQPRPRQSSASGADSPTGESSPEVSVSAARGTNGKLTSRVGSYVRLANNANLSSDGLSASAVAQTQRWYSSRACRVTLLLAVLAVCSLNVAGLVGRTHGSRSTVAASTSSLNAADLAGPADAAESEGTGSGGGTVALKDTIVNRISELTGGTSQSIRDWMVHLPTTTSSLANSSVATGEEARKQAEEELRLKVEKAKKTVMAEKAKKDEASKKFVHAELPFPEVWDSSADACAESLDVPKVALLFLTKGDLFHHHAWRLWFQSAAGVLPRAQVHAAACGGGGRVGDAATLCSLQALAPPDDDAAAAAGVIDQQHLYTVYVHAPPKVQDSELAPLFQGRLVSRRIDAAWGTHGLVEAARNLLVEAFKEPKNQRFVLVSESDIPLYDPLTFYAQMMSEDGSRVNACAHSRTDRRRWTWRMGSAVLKAHHWRKSSQWFMLTRKHTQLVLEDVEVYQRFEEHCWAGHDNDYRRYRDCYSDEHYLPTLFAVLNIQTDWNCGVVGVASTNWSGGAHPRTYGNKDVTVGLVVEALRTPKMGCDADSAWAAAQKMFVKVDEAFDKSLCKKPLPSYGSALTSLCKVTARKFGKDSVLETEALFTDCDNGLHLLSPGVCAATPARSEPPGI